MARTAQDGDATLVDDVRVRIAEVLGPLSSGATSVKESPATEDQQHQNDDE
jgi:hypothetical protein